MKKFLYFPLLVLLLFSCNNDIPQIHTELDHDEQFDDGFLKFYYKNKTYESTYKNIDDSTYLFSDSEVQSVYDKISQNEERLVYIDPDNLVTIFDSYEEYENHKNNAKIKTKVLSSGSPYISYVISFYNHTNVIIFGSSKPHIIIEGMTIFSYSFNRYKESSSFKLFNAIPDYGVYNFHDRLSKITFHFYKEHMTDEFNCGAQMYVTIFEHKNYLGTESGKYPANTRPYAYKYNPGDLIESFGDHWLNAEPYNDIASSHKIFIRTYRER